MVLVVLVSRSSWLLGHSLVWVVAVATDLMIMLVSSFSSLSWSSSASVRPRNWLATAFISFSCAGLSKASAEAQGWTVGCLVKSSSSAKIGLTLKDWTTETKVMIQVFKWVIVRIAAFC